MGITPKKDGTDMVDCAIERPFVSMRTTAKSLDSRVTVEKDVRCNAVPASSTMASSRDHKILNVMPSKFLLFIVHSSIFDPTPKQVRDFHFAPTLVLPYYKGENKRIPENYYSVILTNPPVIGG